MAKKPVKLKLDPDPVRVRALNRGFYGRLEEIELRGMDGKKYKDVGRNDAIINEGEVFDMDTSDMKRPGAYHPEKLKDLETVKTAKGEFVLPEWTTLVTRREKEFSADPDDLVAVGHKTAFRPSDANVL
jgi:hypothetical protein